MHTFYLIRHGQKETLKGDPPLTALGNSQALQTGKFLAQFPISKIVASPMLRTQQTAQHIADHLNLTIETDELLKERMNWGDVEAHSFEEFMREWTKASHERTYAAQGYDSSQVTGRRIESAIAKHVSSDHPHIAFVTHGGAIADFLRNIIAEDLLHSIAKEFPNGKDYNVTECSVTVVKVDQDDISLELLASCDHISSPPFSPFSAASV